MDQLKREIDANFQKFSSTWKADMLQVSDKLATNHERYLISYCRIVSLQAWRSHLEHRISEDSLAFFLEAQNDALVSHVFARMGAWRSALKSLRSCMENVLFCLFYMDHPVELLLWHQGSHKQLFTELFLYFETHPLIRSLNNSDVSGLVTLKEEFSTLSRAVHASSRNFRMTVDTTSPLLWSDSLPSLGSWATREKKVILGINLLLLSLFRDQLEGTNFSDLRKSLAWAIPATNHPLIKKELNITLYRP
jgi:hypothetical protein